MTKVPDFTPKKWDKWLKDKNYAEERVEHLEEELDKALDEQEKLSHAAEELRGERDAEKRLRVQAENDARRAKAAADQAAAAAAAASRSLKIGEKQGVGIAKDGEAQELRVEMQQLKAKNHGLNTQMDALAADHERLAGLLASVEKDKASGLAEAADLRGVIANLEREKDGLAAEKEAKRVEWEAAVASAEAAREESSKLEAQNLRLGEELDNLAGTSKGSKQASGGGGASAADLAAACKAREEAEEHSAMLEAQLSALQTEIRAAREELAALQDEAEMKAGAAREGIAAADAQTAVFKKEAEELRGEVSELREGLEAAKEHEMQLVAVRQTAAESDALRKEADERAAASEARAEELLSELTESQRALKETGAQAPKATGKDEEGTTDQLLEMMTLVKEAEAAKIVAHDELAAKDAKIEELEGKIAAGSGGNDEGAHQSNGERSLGGHDAENGDEDLEAQVLSMGEELKDLHAMLDNVSSERDAALNDLRKAGGGGGSGEDSGDGAQEEATWLRRECDNLRDQLSELEEGEVPPAGTKRIKSLEDQVERLSEEHTRQSEAWRSLSKQMEIEKEDLSRELISAKLQVAQLFMEVDGLKLRHRKETIAASAAHALQLETVNSSPTSSTRSSSKSGAPSPTSPHTMEL